jgi:hypothetical protein
MVSGLISVGTSLAFSQSPFPIKPGIAIGTRMGSPSAIAGNTSLSPIPKGFVAMLMDVSNPAGMRWYSYWLGPSAGGTLSRYTSPNWISGVLGQLFGIAPGDPNTSDFFVSATAIYGIEKAPNYYFAKDSSGKDMTGAVWRLNPMGGLGSGGLTDYELVANLPTTGASLGQVAYNHNAKTLYVSDFAAGQIHVLAAPGNTTVPYTTNQTTVLDRYPSSPAPFLAAADVDPVTPNPYLCAGWGFPNPGLLPNTDPLYEKQIAAYGSRIWAVAYNAVENRVYYSSVNVDFRNAKKNNALGANQKFNEIWSVAVNSSGKFVAGSARLEIKVPYYPVPIGGATLSFGVSDIAFSNDGKTMAIAERGEQIGCAPFLSGYDFSGAHTSRIMTYTLWTSNTGRLWQSADLPMICGSSACFYGTFSGEYLRHTNSAGGVDFGDGYSSSASQSDIFLWSTVNSWQTNAFVNNAPPPSTPQRYIYGAQGILLADAATRSVTAPLNLTADPPKLFEIDYDENVFTVAKNQIGDIKVRRAGINNPIACNCASVESYSVKERTLFARICTPTLKYSEIRVFQGNVVLTPTSIAPPLPLSGPPPYCVDVQVQLTGSATQVHFEMASETNPDTSLAQCCRSSTFEVTLPREGTAASSPR